MYPPLGLPGLHTLEEGQPKGLYVDLLAELSSVADIDFDLRSQPWPEPLDAVRRGSGDVLGPVMGLPSAFIDFPHSAPIIRVEWARYVRRGETRTRNGIAFQGIRVAVLRDTFASHWLEREHPTSVSVPVSTIDEGLAAVSSDKADAFIALKLPTRRVIATGKLSDIEEVGTEITAPMSLAFARQAAYRMPRVNAAIEELRRRGELEVLVDRWMPPAPPSDAELVQERLTIALGVVTGLLLALSVVLLINNRRLRRVTRAAEEARRAKGEFLAVMSHEIRTPINGLVNLIDLLQRSSHNPEQADLLGKAEKANRALLHLVNQVLDFSKIESSRMDIHPKPMTMSALMDQVQAVLESLPRPDEVTLQFLPLPKGLPRVMADEARLAQILYNLGSNALKFTSAGEVSMSVQELPAVGFTGALRLRFEVSDTGVGIAPDQVSRLFQPFVQLHSGLDRPHQGTGLGLSTSAELVRQMGSEIKVHSEPGRLTRFWFDLSLPIVAVTRDPQAPTTDAATPSLVDARVRDATERCVMIVDDNALNLLVTRKILEQEGWRVIEARSAVHAIESLRVETATVPDVVLMDLQMPEIDGLRATDMIRQELGQRMPPVLAVSGAVTEEAQAAARAAGMVGFVPKPFDRATLLAALKRFAPQV